jgi:hypothetical protein
MAKELLDIWVLGKSPIKIEIVQRYLQKYPLKEVAQEFFVSYLLMPPCAEMQIKDWDFHDEFSDQYILKFDSTHHYGFHSFPVVD